MASFLLVLDKGLFPSAPDKSAEAPSVIPVSKHYPAFTSLK